MTLNENDIYFVRAILNKDSKVVPLKVVPLFQTKLVIPQHVNEGEEFQVKLTILNPQDKLLKDIRFNLVPPLEVEATDKLDRYLLDIKPNDSKTLVWNFCALSQSAMATFNFRICTENGGSTTFYKGMLINAQTLTFEEIPTPYISLKSNYNQIPDVDKV